MDLVGCHIQASSDNLYQGWIPAFVLSVYAYPTHEWNPTELSSTHAFVILGFLENERVDCASDERKLRRTLYYILDTKSIYLTTIFAHLNIWELGYICTFTHLNIVRDYPAWMCKCVKWVFVFAHLKSFRINGLGLNVQMFRLCKEKKWDSKKRRKFISGLVVVVIYSFI